jgi:hypothetical protein
MRQAEGEMKSISAIAITLGLGFVPMVHAQHAHLSQQKMCDEQAHKRWQESPHGGDSFLIDKYTSHFDPKTNICYVRTLTVQRGTDDNGKAFSSTSISVEDAFERRDFASLILNSGSGVSTPSLCYVKTQGKTIACDEPGTTKSDFDALTEKYFGIGD